MSDALQLQHVAKRYGSLPVLRDVTLSVTSGSFLSILGRSGEGKTTLLRLIAGFERPDHGTIMIGDRVAHSADVHLPAEQRRIGIVPQEAALFPHLTAAGNVGFGLQRLRPAEREERVREMLALVDMSAFADSTPEQLSGGQQRRIAVARALAPRPDLVLLDEPFAALDSELRRRIRDDVRTALDRVGATAVLVTHDQEEALSIADEVAVLRDGVIAQRATPEVLYGQPADVTLAGFIGESLLLAAQIVEGRAVTALGPLQLAGPAPEGATGQVAIRPESLYLQAHPDGPGVVRGKQYFGHDALIEVALDGLTVHARINSNLTPERGSRVSVWVRGAVNFFAA